MESREEIKNTFKNRRRDNEKAEAKGTKEGTDKRIGDQRNDRRGRGRFLHASSIAYLGNCSEGFSTLIWTLV